MSSEAATFFPDSLADAHNERDALHCAPDTPSLVPNEAQFSIDVDVRFAETLPQISDELLLEQVSDGAKDALAVLFRRYARAVRYVAFRILRHEAEADDLVQDVFLFIFRKAAQFDAKQGSAASWIIRMAYHRALDRRRHLNSRHFYTRLDLEDPSVSLADPKAETSAAAQSIEGILGKDLTARFNARLSHEQRETIQMHFFEGHTLAEIAELTGHSLANVRSHYYRGLERLRKYVFQKESPNR